MCAVDQERSFFPRAVLFLDLLPFQGPFPLTGALTGKPPYGKALYGEASYEKAPYEFSEGCAVSGPSPLQGPLRANRLTGPVTGRLLTRRPLTNYRKAYGKLRGGTLPELGENFCLCAVDQKRSFFFRAVLFLDLLPFQGPFPLTGALTGKPPYGKAPYGEASYEKAPYELQESLREATGRDFTRIGREFCVP